MIIGQSMENVEFLDLRQVNARISMRVNTGARRQANGQKEQQNGNFHREVTSDSARMRWLASDSHDCPRKERQGEP
jgi:hypothetical protein